MTPIQKYAMAAVLGVGLAASAALAQGDAPTSPEGSMQGMMQMMQAMGPMMEACTEMMQQMAHHQSGHPDSAMPPAGQDTTPVPQGG